MKNKNQYEEENRDIIIKLKTLRKQKGLSQQQLGDKIGMSRSKIALIEQGRVDISHEDSIRFANFYDIDPSNLESGSKTSTLPYEMVKINRELYEKIVRLSEQEYRTIEMQIEYILNNYISNYI